jgi:endonuclease III
MRARLQRILKLLTQTYGPRPWKCWGRGVDVLVDTILSQNTSDANSTAGYRRLRRRFRSWNQVANAEPDQVEKCIRISGLSKLKAPRIQHILRQLKSDHGKIDLKFVNEMNEQQAYAYLTSFKGVGPKTAACTLLFAFGKAMFPVDTHIHRLAKRLDLISQNATAEQAQEILTPLIAREQRYAMHVLLIEHGRKTCRAVSPKCEQCVLLKLCPYPLNNGSQSR